MIVPPEKSYDLALKHYESISKEYTETFKMYMQSWSIVGSAVLVGTILGLKDIPDSGTSVRGTLLCATPLIVLLWFLLTSWFWGFFEMYREYLRGLEGLIEKLMDWDAGAKVVRFHSYRHDWYKGRAQIIAVVVACSLGFLLYLVLAWIASRHLVEMLKVGTTLKWTISYALVGFAAFIAAGLLIWRIPPHPFPQPAAAANNTGANTGPAS